MYNKSGDVFPIDVKVRLRHRFGRELERLHNVLRPISEMLGNP